MCFLNLQGLTDEEISNKINLINKKLSAAYNTNIDVNYIDTLENTLSQLYNLQDERSFVEYENNKKIKNGVVMETDPQLAENETIITKTEDKPVTHKREFVGPKIIKTYINEDDDND